MFVRPKEPRNSTAKRGPISFSGQSGDVLLNSFEGSGTSRNDPDVSQTPAREKVNNSVSWRKSPLRPPWTDEARVRKLCTSCGDCLVACPEAILVSGPAGTPAVNFDGGLCTFCGACAEACTEGVFGPLDEAPWSIVATIGAECLLNQGVTCRSCTDACDETALVFDLRSGSVGTVRVDTGLCTGCGACAGTCPALAITFHPTKDMEVAE